jgi:hypothetical protein
MREGAESPLTWLLCQQGRKIGKKASFSISIGNYFMVRFLPKDAPYIFGLDRLIIDQIGGRE